MIKILIYIRSDYQWLLTIIIICFISCFVIQMRVKTVYIYDTIYLARGQALYTATSTCDAIQTLSEAITDAPDAFAAMYTCLLVYSITYALFVAFVMSYAIAARRTT